MNISYVMCLLALGGSGCTLLGGITNRVRPAASSPKDASTAQPTATTTTRSTNARAAATVELPPLRDDGITNATHQKFVGQIVFSTLPISNDTPDESTLVSEFYADEWIYGRAYLNKSIENYPVFEDRSDKPLRTESRGYLYKVFVDGAPVDSSLGTRTVPGDRHSSTTQQVWPRPAPSDEATPRGWVELVNGLSPGDHVVRIELWAQDKWRKGRDVIAAGELTLHKPVGVVIGTGKTFADIKRGMTDAALERDLVAGARAYAKKNDWKETFTAVAIESPAWIDVPHRLGYIMGRKLQTQGLATWPDGKCTAQALEFQQKIERGRPVGPIYVGHSGDQTLLDCTASTARVSDRWNGRSRKTPTPTEQRTATAAPVTAKPEGSIPTAAAPPPTPAPRVTAASASAPIAVATSPAAVETSSGEVTEQAPGRADRRAGRFSVGIGAAINAIDVTGAASYANLGVYFGRVQLGVGATWPFNAIGYARFAVVAGAFELSPMISASVMAEGGMATTEVAISGGLSIAYALTNAPLSIGLRIDALLSYNPEPAAIALPVLGSTYVRF